MDDRLTYSFVVVLVFFAGQTASVDPSSQIFGNGSDYMFPCHCPNNTQCDEMTGECPDGKCDSLLPDGYGWTGPGCQVGNVAYNKPAESNTIVDENNKKYNKPHLWHDADFLVDGSFEKDVFGGSCSVIYTGSKTDLAWWMVDLQDVYAIHNITLVNTENTVDSSYLEDFDITVGNSSDRSTHARCVRHDTRIGKSEHKVLTCDEFQVGRYVAIAKYEERNKVGRLPMCEVVIWGHKWVQVDWKWCADDVPNGVWCENCYGDTSPSCHNAPCEDGTYGFHCGGNCGHCADGETCNSRTGHCENCAGGWKPPLCQQKCDPGTFGFHCLKTCGHCNGFCEVLNGTCPHGCQLWYLGDKCDANIQIVNLDYVTQIYSLFEKATQVILHLPFPEVALDEYHSVLLEYIDEHNPMETFKEYDNFVILYNNETYWLRVKINGLRPNTQYWFRVAVSRSHRNRTETGKPTPKIQVTTRPNAGYSKTSPAPRNTTVPLNATLAAMVDKRMTTPAKSDVTIPYHLHLSALIASLVLICLLLVAIPLVVCYFKKVKTGGFTMGRYVRSNGIENQLYLPSEATQENVSLDDGKLQDSVEFQKSTDNIYSVLTNNIENF